MLQIPALGKEQYGQFVQDRLTAEPFPLSNTIRKNNTKWFVQEEKQGSGHTKKAKVATLTGDFKLFACAYIATAESEKGDLDTFFCHESSFCPPSLSFNGHMRSGDKSSLIGIREGQDYWPDDAPPIDAHI